MRWTRRICGGAAVWLTATLLLASAPGPAAAAAVDTEHTCSTTKHRKMCVQLTFYNDSFSERVEGWGSIVRRTAKTSVRVTNVRVQILRNNGTWRTLAKNPDSDGWHTSDQAYSGRAAGACGAVYRATAKFSWKNPGANVNKTRVLRLKPTVFRC